jgi:hypothetical protein
MKAFWALATKFRRFSVRIFVVNHYPPLTFPAFFPIMGNVDFDLIPKAFHGANRL